MVNYVKLHCPGHPGAARATKIGPTDAKRSIVSSMAFWPGQERLPQVSQCVQLPGPRLLGGASYVSDSVEERGLYGVLKVYIKVQQG